MFRKLFEMQRKCKRKCQFFIRLLFCFKIVPKEFFFSFNFLFKELNRVRKAALTFGFYELFDGLAIILERELINLSSSNAANPETILQLTNCITALRNPEFKDFRKDIQPFVNTASFNRKFNK